MNNHAGHGQKICEFGTVHSQCRCPSNSRTWIECPTPGTCAEQAGPAAVYAPKHRKSTERNFNETRIN